MPVDTVLRHGGDGGEGAGVVGGAVAGGGFGNLDLEDTGREAVVAVDGAHFAGGLLHYDGVGDASGGKES